MASSFITKMHVEVELVKVLRLAEELSLTEGTTTNVSLRRGNTDWIVVDPDNVVSSFLPVSKSLGGTKSQAWRTLLCLRETLTAVKLAHPQIVKTIPAP